MKRTPGTLNWERSREQMNSKEYPGDSPTILFEAKGIIRVFECGTNKYVKCFVLMDKLATLELTTRHGREAFGKHVSQVCRRWEHVRKKNPRPGWETWEKNIMYTELNKVISSNDRGILALPKDMDCSKISRLIDEELDRRDTLPKNRSEEAVRSQWTNATRRTNEQIVDVNIDIQSLRAWEEKNPNARIQDHPKIDWRRQFPMLIDTKERTSPKAVQQARKPQKAGKGAPQEEESQVEEEEEEESQEEESQEEESSSSPDI